MTQHLALQTYLRSHGRGLPTAVVDTQALHHNGRALRASWPAGHHLRFAVKSLGCLEVLRLLHRDLASLSDAPRFMTFSPHHMLPVLRAFPGAHIMAGKPMLAPALRQCLADLVSDNRTNLQRVQFLVDGDEALTDVATAASALDVAVQISLELDIGLRRGGIATAEQLQRFLALLARYPHVQLAGTMGYDGHVGRLPGLVQAAAESAQQARARYHELLAVLQHTHPSTELVRNAAGSLSYQLYREGSPANDLTVGSALIKPTGFDHPHLTAFEPAIYLAIPVLKAEANFTPPGPALLGRALAHWPPSRKQSVFVEGGDYLAEPCYPPGLALDPFLGHSRNQALYLTTRSDHAPLRRGDYILLRPRDSEYAWEAFGDVLLWDATAEHASRYVPTLQVSAPVAPSAA